jgi:hypothetical protein
VLGPMRKIIAALVLVSFPACAADFSARVEAGNQAIATPEGKVYDASLGPAIQAAMVAYVPPGSVSGGKLGKFVLVGSVNATGQLSAIEVKPVTAASQCFANRFGSASLPPPPSSGRWGQKYPVTIEMTVAE